MRALLDASRRTRSASVLTPRLQSRWNICPYYVLFMFHTQASDLDRLDDAVRSGYEPNRLSASRQRTRMRTALQQLLSDFLSAIVFLAIYVLTDSVTLATASPLPWELRSSP